MKYERITGDWRCPVYNDQFQVEVSGVCSHIIVRSKVRLRLSCLPEHVTPGPTSSPRSSPPSFLYIFSSVPSRNNSLYHVSHSSPPNLSHTPHMTLSQQPFRPPTLRKLPNTSADQLRQRSPNASSSALFPLSPPHRRDLPPFCIPRRLHAC
jgi:hypothetical protein